MPLAVPLSPFSILRDLSMDADKNASGRKLIDFRRVRATKHLMLSDTWKLAGVWSNSKQEQKAAVEQYTKKVSHRIWGGKEIMQYLDSYMTSTADFYS